METIKCLRCDDNGVVEDFEDEPGELPCRKCAGAGELRLEQPTCYECEGSGADSGALNEPEPCTVCQGAGVLSIELDPRSSQYGQRKLIARAPLPQVTVSDFAEGGWLRGNQ